MNRKGLQKPDVQKAPKRNMVSLVTIGGYVQ